jgi:hypothetical protein
LWAPFHLSCSPSPFLLATSRTSQELGARLTPVTASIALYLNVFVLVAQLFMKVPSLHVLAPTGSEPPFLISQVVLMAIFIVLTTLTIAATIRFHPEAVHAS